MLRTKPQVMHAFVVKGLERLQVQHSSMCTDTRTYVSSYSYTCTHVSPYSDICVLILVHMHTCVLILLYLSSYSDICAFRWITAACAHILVHMCPHTLTHAHMCPHTPICVLILGHMRLQVEHSSMWTTRIGEPAYSYICPHTRTHAPSGGTQQHVDDPRRGTRRHASPAGSKASSKASKASSKPETLNRIGEPGGALAPQVVKLAVKRES
jgi:hypothetical protein